MAGNKEILLSISILVSGGRKDMWRCLDSLSHLRETVPCELILTDTGCDELTHKRLEVYADKLISFTWCNDFAKARNAGLEISEGKWFMFVDDDEWFDDTDEIEKFFSSGRYKKYGNAVYVQRNYKDPDGIRYADSWVQRLCRRDADTHFQGKIHEYLDPMNGYTALLNDYVHHYGYVYIGEQAKKAHYERNATLLREMIEREPDDLRWWTHLAQEYYAVAEREKLYKLGEDGLEHFKDLDDPDLNSEIGVFYTSKILALYDNGDYDGAYREVERALDDRRNTDMSVAYLSYIGANISMKRKNFEALHTHIARYWKCFYKLENKEEIKIHQATKFVSSYEETKTVFNAECYAICAGAVVQDREMFTKYAKRINVSDQRMYFDDGVAEAIAFALKNNDDDPATALLGKIRSNEELWNELCEAFIKTENVGVGRLCNILNSVEVDEDFRSRIRLLSELEKSSADIGFDELKIRLDAYSDVVLEMFKTRCRIVGDITPQHQLTADAAVGLMIKQCIVMEQTGVTVQEIFALIKQIVSLYPVLASAMKRFIELYAVRALAHEP